MICNQCGCKVPDGVYRCRVCGSTELVASRGPARMDKSFGAGADFGAARPARCAVCGRPLTAGAKFCNGCGSKVMAPTGHLCKSCGRPLTAGAKFCNGCGARAMEAPAAAPMPSVSSAPAPVEPRFSASFKPAYLDEEFSANLEAAYEEAPAVNMDATIVFNPKPVEEIPPVEEIIPEPVEEIVPAIDPVIRAVEETIPAPVIPEPVATKPCPVCGNLLEEDALFCNMCGASMVAAPEVAATAEPQCPVCGKILSAGMKFCNSCGAALAPATEPVKLTKKCHVCGNEMDMGVRFCNMCGADSEYVPEDAGGAEPEKTAVMPVVSVTDPHLKTDRKAKKVKKPKKEKPAGKKSKKGLIIGIVIALVLALLAGAAAVVWFVDPFDWIETDAEKADENKASEVAMDYMSSYYACDFEAVLNKTHNSVLSGYCEAKAVDREDLLETLSEMHAVTTKNLSEGATADMTCKEVKKLSSEDLDELEETYSDDYDLDIKDARKITVECNITSEAQSISETTTLIVCKIGGEWYVDIASLVD